MKKFLTMFVVAALALPFFTSCNDDDDPKEDLAGAIAGIITTNVKVTEPGSTAVIQEDAKIEITKVSETKVDIKVTGLHYLEQDKILTIPGVNLSGTLSNVTLKYAFEQTNDYEGITVDGTIAVSGTTKTPNLKFTNTKNNVTVTIETTTESLPVETDLTEGITGTYEVTIALKEMGEDGADLEIPATIDVTKIDLETIKVDLKGFQISIGGEDPISIPIQQDIKLSGEVGKVTVNHTGVVNVPDAGLSGLDIIITGPIDLSKDPQMDWKLGVAPDTLGIEADITGNLK